MHGQQNIKIPLVHSNFGKKKLTKVMDNLHANLHAFLHVFRKADLFIGMKNISNASCRNERKTRVPTSAPFPDVLQVFETRNRTVAKC